MLQLLLEPNLDSDRASVGELDGVSHQIDEDLFQPLPVRIYLDNIVEVHFLVESNVSPCGLEFAHEHDFLDDIVNREP